MQPITVSIAEACRIVGIGKTSLYAAINAGKIEAVRVGRRRLVKVASLEALIEEAA